MLRRDSGKRVLNGGETAADAAVAAALTVQQARALHLAAQGLLSKPRRRARKSDVLDAIRRMRLLQIDTIHVVARSPYLVLYSRLGTYKPQWLDELLAEGAVFECWAHEACFAPIEDFALHRSPEAVRMNHWAQKLAQRMHGAQRENMLRLLEHIRTHGAVKSSDFESKQKVKAGWWGWKDEKRWLEAWFALGELMVARREKFQRVYDLSERVLAAIGDAADRSPWSAERIRDESVLGAVRALGIAQARWIADYFRTGRKHKDADLQAFVDRGDLVRVAVKGWDVPGYAHRESLPLLRDAAAGKLRATRTVLLSPFDPVVWDRARASALFGFDYTIECYTPAPKRRYGYFVLPILHRGRLVGRLDAKAHRDDGTFEVKAIYLEPSVEPTSAFTAQIAGAIIDCAAWHQTPKVTVHRSEPAAFGKALRAALAR
ncbi:MAG TPA: crosslink repair DNA glycosylase YcaQ family protein [Rudaea sp.]